jgi:hypothetical protein
MRQPTAGMSAVEREAEKGLSRLGRLGGCF